MLSHCPRMLVLAATLALGAATASASAAPAYPDIMPLSHVRPGMTGYGLTVFRGTRIERFNVTVVGVVKKGSLVIPGHDMILVRMSGGPMTTRHAYLIRGMSGSPVYIHGKVIGAFSQGEPMSKEPLGGVTPIEDMLEAWDPKLPQTPLAGLPDNRARTVELARPIVTGGRRIERVVYNVPPSSPLRSHGTTLVMRPCTTFMTFTGLTGAARAKLAKVLEPYHVELTQSVGGAVKPGFKGTPLVPGAAVSMMLVTGDVSAGATGTVSYRKGDRILGFGHPFMGIGPIDAALCSAYIYDVYPLLSGSYKISSPGPVVGASSQDRNFAISGYVGRMPKTIPVTVNVRDLTTGRSRSFHVQTVDHPNLYAGFVSATVGVAVSDVHSMPGPTMAKLSTTVDADEVGKVTRTNVAFDARDISDSASTDLDDLLGILTGNPFYPLGIKSATVDVELRSGRDTAQVDRIFVKAGRFEPGETAEIGVVIKPYKKPAVTRVVRVKVPADAPSGRYVVQVRGGAVPAPVSFGGLIMRSAAPANPDQAPPVSIRQMVNRYDEREKNNDLVARMVLSSTAVNVDGERLSNLPPPIDALMRSGRTSGVRLERDEVRVVEPTEWVISGQQILTINVQRRDTQETPVPAARQSTPPTIPPPGASPAAAAAFAMPKDDEGGPDEAVDHGLASGPGEKKPRPQRGKTETRPSTPGAAEPQAGSGGAGAASTPSATPAGSSASAEDKPVARQAAVWRQSARADFARGQSDGVSVTTGGDLALARSFRRLVSTNEEFVWSVVTDGQGGLYAGTGTQGRILHVRAAGQVDTLATLPELSVQALLRDPSGTLWAATTPRGRLYRVSADGRAEVAFQAPEKYALALARDSAGSIYLGTGGGTGAVYRVTPDGKGAVFYKTAEEHVLSLAVDAAGNVYAGTGNSGIVYRITPDGSGKALYDAQEQSITALAVGDQGAIYAATAPQGAVYRIAADGSARAVLEKAPSAFTALQRGPDGTVYAAGGDSVYAIGAADTIAPLTNGSNVDFLSLAVGPDGTLCAGTGNVAEVYAAAPAQAARTGAYVSVVHDAKQRAQWGGVRWTSSTPAGTQLSVETRTGDVAEPDGTWSRWQAPRPQPDGGRVQSPSARFIQYRVTMHSDSSAVSPVLRDISITYLPKNQPPTITFQTPSGGERWSKQQTVKWQASDPDKDTLSYELLYSADSGAHWQPLPASATPAAAVAPAKAPAAAAPSPAAGAAVQPPAPQASAGARRSPPTVAEVQAELDRHPDLPKALREAVLARAREMSEEYQAQAAAGAAAATAAAASAGSRETSRSIDTKSLPDGTYRLRVVASDRPGNAANPLTAEAVSEPFVVCNAPPALYLLQSATRVNPDGSASIEGTAVQKLVAVTAVQYRIDGGEWLAAAPSDGLFDSPIESFTVTTLPMAPGTHTIEAKAYNAAGLSATEKTTVVVAGAATR